MIDQRDIQENDHVLHSFNSSRHMFSTMSKIKGKYTNKCIHQLDDNITENIDLYLVPYLHSSVLTCGAVQPVYSVLQHTTDWLVITRGPSYGQLTLK